MNALQKIGYICSAAITFQTYGMSPAWFPYLTEEMYSPLPRDWTAYFQWKEKPQMALAETALVSDLLSVPLTIVAALELFVRFQFMMTDEIISCEA